MTHDVPSQGLPPRFNRGEVSPTMPPATRGSVLLLDSDLFFVVRVMETLARAGYTVRKLRGEAEFDAALRAMGKPGAEQPAAALVNLAARGVDALGAIERARAADVPVIAYGPHVDTAGQAAARQAGATSVIANAKLVGDLPGVLARTVRRAALAVVNDRRMDPTVVNDRRTDEGVDAAETVHGPVRTPALQGREEGREDR